MKEFIIPHGVRILRNKLKVNSNSIIPPFDTVNSGCDDNGLIKISKSYNTQTTEGDFLLFLGVINEPNDWYLAYASYCVLGKNLNNLI